MPRHSTFDFEKYWDRAQKWFFLPLGTVILALLLAWSIDSVRAWLQQHGLKDLDVPAVVGIVLAATMFVLVSFQRQLREVRNRLNDFSPSSSSRLISGGIQDVYAELGNIIAEIGTGPGGETGLDVVGLTLFTAWPMLVEPHLRKAQQPLRGWRVRLFVLSPEFTKSNAFFKQTWTMQAEAQISTIREFEQSNQALLKGLGGFEVTAYKFFPAIHGFRTDAGHLLISYIHWNDDDVLEGPTQFYELFHPSDKSARARSYRALFDNWVTRANKDRPTGRVV
jgi:hypothetical protein